MVDLNNAVYELHKKGYSFNQIAQELNISKSKAYRIINNTVNDIKNVTVEKPIVSKPFQNVPKQPERGDMNVRNSSNNLKLQVKLRKMELQHESEMRRLEFEEKERIREYEAEQNSVKNENLILKTQLENLREEFRIVKLKNETLKRIEVVENIDDDFETEESSEDEFIEEEYIPELDIMLQDEIKELLNHILKTDKYFENDLKKMISKISKLKQDVIEQADIEDVEVDFFEELNFLKEAEEVVRYYQESFNEHTSLFGSTINLYFDEVLFTKMEEYVNNASE